MKSDDYFDKLLKKFDTIDKPKAAAELAVEFIKSLYDVSIRMNELISSNNKNSSDANKLYVIMIVLTSIISITAILQIVFYFLNQGCS